MGKSTFWRHKISFDIGNFSNGNVSEEQLFLAARDLISQIDSIIAYENELLTYGLGASLYSDWSDDLHNVRQALYVMLEGLKFGLDPKDVDVESWVMLLDSMYSELMDIGNYVVKNHSDGVREQFICV